MGKLGIMGNLSKQQGIQSTLPNLTTNKKSTPQGAFLLIREVYSSGSLNSVKPALTRVLYQAKHFFISER